MKCSDCLFTLGVFVNLTPKGDCPKCGAAYGESQAGQTRPLTTAFLKNQKTRKRRKR